MKTEGKCGPHSEVSIFKCGHVGWMRLQLKLYYMNILDYFSLMMMK